MSNRLTGIYFALQIRCTLWNVQNTTKHTHTHTQAHLCIHTCQNSQTHIMLTYMFVPANMKRKLPLPNSSSWEIPVFYLPGRAGDAAGPDLHQTADEFGDGRKEGSILINLHFGSMPLLSTCMCSVYCVLSAFTRDTFWFKANSFELSLPLKKQEQLKTFTPIFKERVHYGNIQT